MTYAEKLRNPRWQKKRLKIMERDKFKCVECGSGTTTLNVHHIRYIRGKYPWQYPNKLLVTLCEKCHFNKHHKPLKPNPTPDSNLPAVKIGPEVWSAIRAAIEASGD